MDKSAEESSKDKIIKWLQEVVIKLGLCPFANKPYSNGKVMIASYCGDYDGILGAFKKEITSLEENDSKIETTLLGVCVDEWIDFHRMWDETYFLEEYLEQQGLEEKYQLAYFHPEFEFDESTNSTDVHHWVHRSPVPIVHILRWDSINKVEDSFGDLSQIQSTNNATLESWGSDYIKKWLDDIRK